MKHQPIRLDTMSSEIKSPSHSQLQLSTLSSYSSPALFPTASNLKPLLRFCGYQLLNYGPDTRTFLPCFAISISVTIFMTFLSSSSHMPTFMKYLLYAINFTQNISYFITATLNPGVIRVNEKQTVDDVLVECRSCGIYRGVRSSHCHECNSCIRGYDHHCPFVGKCVGRYNMVPFVLFILTTAVGFMYNFVFAIGTLSMMKQE